MISWVSTKDGMYLFKVEQNSMFDNWLVGPLAGIVIIYYNCNGTKKIDVQYRVSA